MGYSVKFSVKPCIKHLRGYWLKRIIQHGNFAALMSAENETDSNRQ